MPCHSHQKQLVVKVCREGERKEEEREDYYIFLRDDWQHTELQPGDLVQLVGRFPDSPSHQYIVSNYSGGYILVNPDHLISGTTISSSIECARR